MTEIAAAEIPALEEQPSIEQVKAFACVLGQQVTELPQDLYIPPDALEVVLEVFEGPLDLLLYLIKKNNLDILNIPVADITHQYVQYIELMVSIKLELAADYLEMAALLAEIKSRMLLPRPKEDDEEDIDPRAELVRRLQVYEQIKEAAVQLDEIPRRDRDIFLASAQMSHAGREKPQPDVDLEEVLLAFQDVLKRVDLQTNHMIGREMLTVRERMSKVLDLLNGDAFIEFSYLFEREEGRLGAVVTLLAILELAKERMIEITQAEPYTPIYIRVLQDDGHATVTSDDGQTEITADY